LVTTLTEAKLTGLLRIHGEQAGVTKDISGLLNHQAPAPRVFAVLPWNHHTQHTPEKFKTFYDIISY